ncbi:acetate/propionate family kinase [Yoonia vestfoldensis]|uniref:acetate/propionate family kinase n=1 Tax=Yoonia vestfoldensis TaxID=245188 RepID=UPI000366A05D|nr:acetate/propionate family kinase [Yoonia vestfoldensis]
MILVVNTGSSSVKVALFDGGLARLASGEVTEIGGAGLLKSGGDHTPIRAADHASALAALLDALDTAGQRLTAAAHRIVHGGADLTAPTRVTPDVIAQISACNVLAPLHNPHNIAGIAAIADALPDLPQYVSFDTAFHATNPAIATTYALPPEETAKGIRRYGFHGLSYQSLVQSFADTLPDHLLAFHLGNGASLCAIKDGKSVASSMGYSPLDGLVMGTRTGSIDGMAVLRLAKDHGIAAAGDILNRQSGLRALGGTSDMAALLQSNSDSARFAVEHFCYWAARHAGSAIVAMGGLDAVAFTGGIGENAPEIREQIMDHLAFLGKVPVHVIAADEEKQIARDALTLLAQDQLREGASHVP